VSTAAFTSEFDHAFEAETGRLLRTRFLWLLGANLVLWALGALGLALRAGALVDAGLGGVAVALLSLLDAGVLGWFFLRVRGSRPDKGQLLTLTRLLLVYVGVVGLAPALLPLPAGWQWLGPLTPTANFALAFLLAALFLPWSPGEVLPTVASVLGLHAAVFAAASWPPGPGWLVLLAYPFLVAPGLFVCWVRHGNRLKRFQVRFLASRYGEVRRELTDARRIHEDLFPTPRATGDLLLAYRYEPMRQMGGDFLFFRDGGEEAGPSCVLLDVTGHGLAAALTVNRLHGELERIFAEDPAVEPGRVLALLNRYVHLTLAQHSIYASGVCLRVDRDAHTLAYASAGHPPMLLRAVDGRVEELASTTLVLGACPAGVFEPGQRSVAFAPGDALVAYTDGAIEARDRGGRLVGRRWLAGVLAGNAADPGAWPRRLLEELDRRRDGPPLDDTLLVELRRLLESERPPAGTPPAGADAAARRAGAALRA